MAAPRPSAVRTINAFGYQRGVKIVQYDPESHADLVKANTLAKWADGHVSRAKFREILAVADALADVKAVRKARGRAAATARRRELFEKLPHYKRFALYLATTVLEGRLVVLGLVQWAKYYPADYLMPDEAVWTAAEAAGRSAATEAERNDLLSDDQVPTAWELREKKQWREQDLAVLEKASDLGVLVVDPTARQKGLGRLLLAYALNRVLRYHPLLFRLGLADGEPNKRMVALLADAGATPARLRVSLPTLDVEDELLPDGATAAQFRWLPKKTPAELKELIEDQLLALDRRPELGHICRRRPGRFERNAAGIRYQVDECEGGLNNPHARHYLIDP